MKPKTRWYFQWCYLNEVPRTCLNQFGATAMIKKNHAVWASICFQKLLQDFEDILNYKVWCGGLRTLRVVIKICFIISFGQNAQTLCWNRTRTKTHARKHVVPWWKRDRAGLSSCGTKNLCGSLDTQGELDQMGWGELKGQVSYKFVLKRTVSPSSVPNGPKVQKSQTFKNFFTLGGPGIFDTFQFKYV